MALKPKRLVADTAYGGTGKFLGWMIGTGVKPLWDKPASGWHLRADFTFNEERNLYVCPTGKLLMTTGSVGAGHVLR